MDTTLFSDYTWAAYGAIAYVFVAFALFALGKMSYQLFHPGIDVKKELVINDNFSFSIAHTGYFIGLLLAIGGTIIGESNGLIADIVDMIIYGTLAILLLNLSIFFNDKVILRKFSVEKEIIVDRNAGTGLVEGASAVAAGLILFGAISGDSSFPLLSIFTGDYPADVVHPAFGLLTAVAFWAIGQLAIVLTTKVYNWITPYDIHQHIEEDNVAVGLGFAGAIVAIGILISYALMGNFDGWGVSLLSVLTELVIGLIFLPVARYLADKILLPGQDLTDELVNQEKANVGAALIEAFSYIGGAVLITWCI